MQFVRAPVFTAQRSIGRRCSSFLTNMDNRLITIISNIKVIGWITMLTYSGVLFYCCNSLISAFLVNRMGNSMLSPTDFNNPDIIDMNSFLSKMTFIITFISLIAIAGIFIGRGLTNIRKWAAIAFHILSITFGLLIIGGAIYLMTQLYPTSTDDFSEMKDAIMKYQAMTIGTLGLLITWLITKANMLLFRKDYRLEMN